MPNLGRPTQTTDGFGNVITSPHAPSAGGFNAGGQYVAPEDSTQTPATDMAGNPITSQSLSQPQSASDSQDALVTQDSTDTPKSMYDLAQEWGVSLEEANAIRQQQIQKGYSDYNRALSPYASQGQRAFNQYARQIMGGDFGYTPDQALQQQYLNQLGQGSGVSNRLMGLANSQRGMKNLSLAEQAAQTGIGSDYLNQAGQIATQGLPSRLEDIEGYDLMRQARDEALMQSGERFGGAGKMYSGSRMREAGDIGAQAAQNLISQARGQQQQQFQNLMGLGAQDVGIQQQNMQNLLGTSQAGQSAVANQFGRLMGAEQYGNQLGQQNISNLGQALGYGQNLDQLNYARNQQQLAQMGVLGQTGLGLAGQIGQNKLNQALGMGETGYQTQMDKANMLMGGKQQDIQQQLAEAGLSMQQQQANQGFWGDIIGAGALALPWLMCDERLKENINPLGKLGKYNWYEFNYIGDDKVYRGPMAQEVVEINPQAVVVLDSGYLAVNLEKL